MTLFIAQLHFILYNWRWMMVHPKHVLIDLITWTSKTSCGLLRPYLTSCCYEALVIIIIIVIVIVIYNHANLYVLYILSYCSNCFRFLMMNNLLMDKRKLKKSRLLLRTHFKKLVTITLLYLLSNFQQVLSTNELYRAKEVNICSMSFTFYIFLKDIPRP